MKSGSVDNRLAQQRQLADYGGFTIIETLIFLAVSSALLVSSLALFVGPQRKTEFLQGLDDVNQQLNTIVNNVTNGYYPRINGVTSCNVLTDPVTITEDSTAPAEDGRGSNSKCIFVGRAVQFIADEDHFNVYSIVGARQVSGATGVREISTLSEAKPTPLTSVDQLPLKNGISIKTLRIKGESSNKGVIGFFSGFGSYIDGGDKLRSGALTTDYTIFPNSSLSPGPDPFASFVADLMSVRSSYETIKNPQTGIELCFESGATKQFGTILIGGKSSSATTKVKIENGVCPT